MTTRLGKLLGRTLRSAPRHYTLVFIIWMITNAFKALFNVCLCVCVCRRVWSGWAGWTAAPRPRCVKASR